MCVCVCACAHARTLSHVQHFVIPWTVAHQVPLSVGFSWQQYWSGLPFLPPGDLPHSGIEPMFVISPALAIRFFSTSTLGCHFLLQGIFQTQGLNLYLLCLLYCRWILYLCVTWEAPNEGITGLKVGLDLINICQLL